MNKHVFIGVLLALMTAMQVTAQEKRALLTVELGDYKVAKNVTLSGNAYQGDQVCDDSRTAKFEFPLEEGEFFTLTIGLSRNKVYVEPEKPLTVKVQKNAEGGFSLLHLDLQFAGENAAENEYLNKRDLKWLEDNDFLLDEKAYLKKMQQYERQNEKTIRAFRLNKNFERRELIRARYQLYEPLTRYPMQHFWQGGNQTFALWIQDETPVVKDYITRYLVDDAELWKDEVYRKYVKGAVSILALADLKIDWEKIVQRRTEVLEKYFKTPVILEDMVHYMTTIYVEGTQGAPLKSLQEIYDRHVKRADYKEELKKMYAVYEKLQSGEQMLSSNAAYYDMEGKAVSLEDLKGKYLYIDVWATWCGPCRQEIPHLKKLEEQFHGKNIHFVSISLDARRKDWMAMVEKEQLGGIQLLGGPEAQIAIDYKINGIPRFLLFDRDGKLINNNMPRPSDAQTAKMLEQLEGI